MEKQQRAIQISGLAKDEEERKLSQYKNRQNYLF